MLSQQDAPFNPATPAVCYEHLVGINPRLGDAFDQAKQVRLRLYGDAIGDLYRSQSAHWLRAGSLAGATW
jgi:hypothetical protein